MEFEKMKDYLDFKFGDYGWNLSHWVGSDKQELIIIVDMEKYNKEFSSYVDDDVVINEIENCKYKKWKNETISLTLKCIIEILERNKFDLGNELSIDLSNDGTLLDGGNCRCYDIDKIDDFYFNSDYNLIKFKYKKEDITIDLCDYYYYEDDNDCDFLLGFEDNCLCEKSNCIKDECSCWDGDSCLL